MSIFRFILAFTVLLFMPLSASYAQDMSDDIPVLCSQIESNNQAACLKEQYRSFEAVKSHMNAIITSGAKTTETTLTHYLPDLISCLESSRLKYDLINYVSAHACMRSFSLARSD